MDFNSDAQRNHDAIQWRISSYLDSFFALYGLSPERRKSQNLLIQFWAATNHTSEEGQRYCLLTTRDQPYDYIFSDHGLCLYRNYSLGCVITINEHENQQNQQQSSVPGRVYKNKMPEITPDISYYSEDDYPHRKFALSCGFRSSFCLPVFEDSYKCPNGVLELVSTSDDLEILINHIYSSYSYSGLRMITQVKHPFRLNLQDIEIPLCTSKEIDRVLRAACENFGLPLAQCWVIGNHNLCTFDHLRGTPEALAVINFATSIHSESITSWCKFKKACWEMCMRKDQGVVGKAFSYHRAFFCKDITTLSMSQYPLAHFARKCGTIACFTICLQSSVTDYRDYVLEFFLPDKMDSDRTQTLLNSLFDTLKEHHQTLLGEGIGEELCVEVVSSSSMHEESESFKIGVSKRILPRHVACENKSRDTTLVNCNRELMMECGTQQNKYVLDVRKGHLSTSFLRKTAVKQTLNRKLDSTAEIIDLDELGEGLPVKFIECDEPQSFNFEAKRSLLEKQISKDNGESTMIDQQPPVDEATEHNSHMLDTDKVNGEESPVDAVGYTTTTASQPTSFQTMKSLPQQEIEETVVLETVTQKLLLSEDVLQIKNEGIRENDSTNIQFLSETCIEDTSERENKSDISFECLRKHFGRSLNDAAKSFGVSRSTFKRICRGLGIERWQYGKRRMDYNISSGLGRKLHDDRSSKKNFSCSSIAPVQDTVAHTSQKSTKMTIKAAYNGVTIRFELPVSSGISELEDNVIERLDLERKSFSIKYQDDEGDWVLIACDKDLQECMKISRSSHKTTIKMLLDPPIN